MMMKPSLRWMWLLVTVALVACATVSSTGSESPGCEEVAQAASFEQVCQQANSVVALCPGEQCGVYRCREVMEGAEPGRVVRTRGGVAVLLRPPGGAQRNWGSAQELPEDTRPVFIIPWRHKPPLLPSQQQMLDEEAKERRKPHEQHHIFPRAFRLWFTDNGIDIDQYIIPLAVEKHRSIHRGADGGPWNAAWKKFIDANRERKVATEEIHRYAGQLIYEFQLFGPVLPYSKQPPPMPSGY